MAVHEFPERTFKVWDYVVSHKQMVIRSPRREGGPPNLDLYFRGVAYFRSVTLFEGLSIVEPTDAEIAEAQEAVAPRRCDPDWVRVLESGGQRNLVVADRLEVGETDFPLMSTVLDHAELW